MSQFCAFAPLLSAGLKSWTLLKCDVAVLTWSDLGSWQWIQLCLFVAAAVGPYLHAIKRGTPFSLATVLSLVLCYLVQLVGLGGWVLARGIPVQSLLYAEPLTQSSMIEWHRFISAAWVHGGPTHLLGNVIVIGLCGLPLEQRLGRVRWSVVYLVGAIGGNLFWMLAHLGQYAPALGASGAAFGLLGAYLSAWPNDEIEFPLILIRAWPVWMIAMLRLGLELVFVFSESSGLTPADGVANLAHVGGFFAAYVIARPLARGGLIPPEIDDGGPSAGGLEAAKNRALKHRMGDLSIDPWSTAVFSLEGTAVRTLERLRAEGDELETRQAWLDLLAEQAPCPVCEQPLTCELVRQVPVLRCTVDGKHIDWP